MFQNQLFLTDKELADALRLKASTIRSQRHKRRHGEDHWLTIDPVMIGHSPRYAVDAVTEFIETQLC